MKQILITLATALLVFGSCSKMEKGTDISDQMQFQANYPAGVRATGDAFETGDAMGVYVTQYNGDSPAILQVSGNYANNVKSQFDGTVWKNTPQIYWADGKFDVYAYYPYAKPASVDEYKFSVALDQNIAETADALSSYEASDFLWAKATGVTRVDKVPLHFNHKMSKLVVKLVKGSDYSGDIPADAVVTIHNTVPSSVVDLATGAVMKDPYGKVQSIKAKKVSDGNYTAILVPQRLDNKQPLVEITSKGVSYLIESKFVFRSGVQHTLNITLNNNPDKVKIEIGGEIEGWGEE